MPRCHYRAWDGNYGPPSCGLAGVGQPIAMGGPRAASRPWGPPTKQTGGVTPGRNAQSFDSERRPTRWRRPAVRWTEGVATNPRCKYGGPEAAPNLQHLGTPGSLPGYLSLRATPPWVLSKGPEGIERRRVGHCGWNSKPQTCPQCPAWVVAWCRGRHPGAVLFTRSTLGVAAALGWWA